MIAAIKKLNANGITLSKSKLLECTDKYAKQYWAYCYKLHGMGYLASPELFNESNFLQCLFEEFPEVMSFLRNMRLGDLSCTLLHIDYAIKLSSSNKVLNEILTSYYKVKEASLALDSYVELQKAVKIPKKSDTFNVKCSLYASGRMMNDSKVDLNNQFIHEIFDCELGQAIKFDWILVKAIATRYMTDECFENEFRQKNKSVLFSGNDFTFEDDCKYYRMILDGEIVGTSKYGKKFFSDIMNHYESYYLTQTTKADCSSLGNNIFIASIDQCYDYIRDIRNEFETFEVVYVTDHEVILKKESTDDSVKFPLTELYIGDELLDFMTGETISIEDRLRGYSGLYIHESDLRNIQYTDKGQPVLFNSGYWYPICSVYNGDSSICKVRNYNRSFLSEGDICKMLNVDSMERISNMIANSFQSEKSAEYKLLVGRLVQSLICIECDYILPFHTAPNHVILSTAMSALDSEILKEAFRDSERVFKSFGF